MGCHNEREDICLTCVICETRKEKRFCPAVHGRICPVCCGEQREVTLDCPSDCIYLQQARRSEGPRSIADVPREELFPNVEIPDQFLYDREPLFAGLSYAVAQAARADRSITDRDAIAALTAMAKSYETLVNSGLVYETPTASISQHAIAGEMTKLVEQYRKTEEKHLGHSTLRDSEVLKAVVFILRIALTRTSGRPKSRAFLDFLYEQFPEKQSVIAGPEESEGRIIIP